MSNRGRRRSPFAACPFATEDRSQRAAARSVNTALTEFTAPGVGFGSLFERVPALIEQGRQVAAAQTNVALTLTYWYIGRLVGSEVLGDKRAQYGRAIVATLGRQLRQRYGPGYESKERLARRQLIAAEDGEDK